MGSGAQLNYSPTIAPNDISDTSYALHIGDQGTFQLDKCLVFGGSNCVLVEGFDLLSNDSWVAFGYGTSNWLQRGNGLWVHRLNLDHQYPVGSTSTDSDPWQAGHVYSANDLAVVDGFNLQCLTGGTSAGTAPTILPYLQEIDDGSVTWLLASRVDSSSYEQNSGGSECYLNLVDITSCTENAIRFVDDFSSVPSYINMSQSIIGGTIGPAMSIRAGHSVFMSNCLCGPIEFIDDWAGNAYISHNNIGGGNTAIYLGSTAVNHDFSHNRFSSPVGAGSTAIEIDAATTALVIESNILGNYATGISLVTGCNQYVIANNDASSITSDPLVDNANGNIKTIQGNLGIDDILGNKVTYSASTTDRASLQIPTGAAPTSPIDGEIWREDNTDTGLKIRINGMTKTIVVA
jgi:hypothetical protein